MQNLLVEFGKPTFNASLTASLLLPLAACGCVAAPKGPPKAYRAVDDGSLSARYAPIFVIQSDDKPYNRIGTPTAAYENGREKVFIDTSRPTVYVQQETFRTDKAAYKNLIYRAHFERVPFSIIPFNLTAGRNVGVMTVITLDAQDKPVLVTTVHTCGCYKAFVPTNFLPADAKPDGWKGMEQDVYGERLPRGLHFPEDAASEHRLVVFLRNETHRVMGLAVRNAHEATTQYPTETMELAPMERLHELPLDGKTTPFFHTKKGAHHGYVKGSSKPFEMILMGWIALDFYVGRDKDYGDSEKTGAVFYTSLKPWRRTDSDMWRFGEFLHYWGWRL